MKFGKRPRLHVSILACLGLVFGLFVFFTPSAHAACSGVDTAGDYSCVLSNGSQVWCANATECVNYKKASVPANTSSTYTQKDDLWNQILDAITNKPRQKYFPDQGCNKGINTALGCIPYTTDELGPALFGLLVGVAGMIALLLMLFATSLYITSGGDHEKLKKAKELFTAAVTGLVFIIFSVVLLRITAGDILQVPGF